MARIASRSDFADWAETPHNDPEYNFLDCTGLCGGAQYMAACGESWSLEKYLRFIKAADIGLVLYEKPWTFSAAAKRAREGLQ